MRRGAFANCIHGIAHGAGGFRSFMWLDRSTGIEKCHQHDGATQFKRIA